MVYYSGTLYYYNTTLPIGTSTYRFICIDTESSIVSTLYQSIVVSNESSYTERTNSFCYVWSNSTASAFVADHPAIAWIATYNESTSKYVYYYSTGFGTDFPMTYGFSYLVGASTPFTVILPALLNNTTLTLPYSSSFRGNPTGLPVPLSDLFNSSPYLSWIGIKTGSHYTYYYRNSSDLTYLIQLLQAVFFGCTRVTTITI